ncbi:MAG: hypothetical protein V1799_12400 [bacterium]
MDQNNSQRRRASAILGALLYLWAFLTLLSCNISDQSASPAGYLIYSTSFEDSTDLKEWRGHGGYDRYAGGSPNGGKFSLYVAGGCIVPHAQIDLPPLRERSALILRCWGRRVVDGGSVTLSIIGPASAPSAHLVIADSVWKHYSTEKIVCPENAHPQIALMAGGIKAASMLVDNIEVLVIDE